MCEEVTDTEVSYVYGGKSRIQKKAIYMGISYI